jgi:ketosteroid isomerase-like protein
MSGEQHLGTVQGIYQAFGSGDVPAILDRLAEDVAWEQWADNSAQRAGVPWAAARHGREGAAEFFGVVGGLEIADFQILSMMASEDQVAVEVLIEVTTPEGGHYRDEELHLWTFDADGKVKRMRHYVDTAKHIEAAGKASTVVAGRSLT